MKTKTKTLKGWANNSGFLFSENTQNDQFTSNLKKYINQHLKGYTRLKAFDTLRGKNASEKIIIRGRYWRGSWADPTNEIFCIYYK